MLNLDPSQLYPTFISIVFGVFFAVWIIPLSKLYLDQPKDDLETTLSAMITLKSILGAEMFIILVCLWWWYGTFIGNIAPAHGFLAYLYDFISLCSFAVAFQMWSHRTLFPIVVFSAALLMLGRLWHAEYKIIEPTSPANDAVWYAIIGLFVFMAGAVLALISAAAGFQAAKGKKSGITFRTSIKNIWGGVEIGVMILLVIGIVITFAAVSKTEGFELFKPIKPEVWMKAG